jgi:hypothetical protein
MNQEQECTGFLAYARTTNDKVLFFLFQQKAHKYLFKATFFAIIVQRRQHPWRTPFFMPNGHETNKTTLGSGCAIKHLVAKKET